MAKKRHTAEEIVAKLRQVDVLMARGRQVADAVRAIGGTEVTYYRWRNEYGGLKGDQVKRLKELETENSRLRRAVSDLTLDKLILAEAAKGNFFSIRGTWRKSFFENPHCRRSSCEELSPIFGDGRVDQAAAVAG